VSGADSLQAKGFVPVAGNWRPQPHPALAALFRRLPAVSLLSLPSCSSRRWGVYLVELRIEEVPSALIARWRWRPRQQLPRWMFTPPGL